MLSKAGPTPTDVIGRLPKSGLPDLGIKYSEFGNSRVGNRPIYAVAIPSGEWRL
jgi:hypothetical protein